MTNFFNGLRRFDITSHAELAGLFSAVECSPASHGGLRDLDFGTRSNPVCYAFQEGEPGTLTQAVDGHAARSQVAEPENPPAVLVASHPEESSAVLDIELTHIDPADLPLLRVCGEETVREILFHTSARFYAHALQSLDAAAPRSGAATVQQLRDELGQIRANVPADDSNGKTQTLYTNKDGFIIFQPKLNHVLGMLDADFVASHRKWLAWQIYVNDFLNRPILGAFSGIGFARRYVNGNIEPTWTFDRPATVMAIFRADHAFRLQKHAARGAELERLLQRIEAVDVMAFLEQPENLLEFLGVGYPWHLDQEIRALQNRARDLENSNTEMRALLDEELKQGYETAVNESLRRAYESAIAENGRLIAQITGEMIPELETARKNCARLAAKLEIKVREMTSTSASVAALERAQAKVLGNSALVREIGEEIRAVQTRHDAIKSALKEIAQNMAHRIAAQNETAQIGGMPRLLPSGQ